MTTYFLKDFINKKIKWFPDDSANENDYEIFIGKKIKFSNDDFYEDVLLESDESRWITLDYAIENIIK